MFSGGMTMSRGEPGRELERESTLFLASVSLAIAVACAALLICSTRLRPSEMERVERLMLLTELATGVGEGLVVLVGEDVVELVLTALTGGRGSGCGA